MNTCLRTITRDVHQACRKIKPVGHYVNTVAQSTTLTTWKQSKLVLHLKSFWQNTRWTYFHVARNSHLPSVLEADIERPKETPGSFSNVCSAHYVQTQISSCKLFFLTSKSLFVLQTIILVQQAKKKKSNSQFIIYQTPECLTNERRLLLCDGKKYILWCYPLFMADRLKN